MVDSKRSSKGFQQLPNESTPTMINPNDATIDIPLNTVNSKTGVRRSDTLNHGRQPDVPDQQMNEKSAFYQRHVAGRRKAAKKPGMKGEDGEEDSVNGMGKIYNKILNFSIVTRYFLYVLPLAIIFALPIIIGATAAPNAKLGGVRIVWIFSWLEIVWLSLWVSKLTAKLLPSIFQFLCGIVSSGTRKYALVLQSLEIYLSLSGWALASLATFVPVMTRNPTLRDQKAYANLNLNSQNETLHNQAVLWQNSTQIQEWESIVQAVLAAFLVVSLILLGEKLFIQLISIGYHRTQFNAKIQESKHKIHLLGLLYAASRSLFPAYCNEFAEEDYIINDAIDLDIIEGKLGKKHNRSGSATPMRLIQNIGRVGDKVTSVFGNIAQEVTGKQVFNPGSAHSIVVEALEKNKSSEALAKRLWMSFVVEGKEALFLEDIVEVLGPDHQDEADEAFAVLDRDGNGDISLDEMILTVCEFGKERHSIATSLHDVDQAINVLDQLLCTVVFIATIFIFVAFLNKSFTTTLATAGTALLSLSFVFATTCQEVLGSCIFLFVKHPYDVLDRVDIGDDQLIVKHISLLFTVFKHVNNHKLTQVPNIVLNAMWIQNVTRSEAMREQLKIYIDFATTLEDIQLLKNEMQAFVNDKENSRDFQTDIDVEITGIAEMNKMELKVEIRHKSNWANETIRAARRSKFMCALVLALRKIPINAPGGASAALGSADAPSYSVAVSDAQAAANREAYKAAQEAKRLFPTKKTDVPDQGSTKGVTTSTETPAQADSKAAQALRHRQPPESESTALATLNSRHPAADTAHAPNDVIEPATPKSVAFSVSAVSGTETPIDIDRSVSIEEVRGILRRQSTRGKRKASVSSKVNPISGTSGSLPGLHPSMNIENDPYTPSTGSESPAAPQIPAFPQPARTQPQIQPQPSLQASPPRQAQNQSPLSHLQSQFQSQQRPPTSQPQQPRQAPPIQPPAKPYLNTSNLNTPTDSEQPRAISPVRNPFQITALRSQAQGVGVPQMRRPVPGSGNSFAQQQEESGAVRPPRGDSLAESKNDGGKAP